VPRPMPMKGAFPASSDRLTPSLSGGGPHGGAQNYDEERTGPRPLEATVRRRRWERNRWRPRLRAATLGNGTPAARPSGQRDRGAAEVAPGRPRSRFTAEALRGTAAVWGPDGRWPSGALARPRTTRPGTACRDAERALEGDLPVEAPQ